MLAPKKQKFRKSHRLRGKRGGIDYRGNTLSFGTFGIKALSSGEINSRQIESARKVLTRYTKRGGRIWIRIFPDKAISRKAAEVPMGGGKGAPEFYAMQVHPGRVLFEMDGIDPKMAKEALELAIYKLPVQCKFMTTLN
ncbi:MAG: 50S ribosomal protein L16 [Patescibacteria group bacterium]